MYVLETNSVAHRLLLLLSVFRDLASYLDASSNSIFFDAASSFAMRKLRTCPALAASGLDMLPLPPLEAAPPFQRAVSMELNDDKSALPSACAAFSGSVCFSGTMWHVPKTPPSPSSTR